jgi:Permuted papain-like amidase enzyme, YaeF/YiiX, C92 family
MFKKLANFVVFLIGKINWEAKKTLSEDQSNTIKKLLISDYYIILTRRSTHLSTFFIGLANFILKFKWGYWSHVLMNTEDEVKTDSDFRLLEATSVGVKFTPFEHVFNLQAVALLKPKYMELSAWTKVLDKAKTKLGTPYDTIFDLANDQEVSCVELVRVALMAEDNYAENFKHFEEMIKKSKNLTPQMFFECDDFEIVYEAKCQ